MISEVNLGQDILVKKAGGRELLQEQQLSRAESGSSACPLSHILSMGHEDSE